MVLAVLLILLIVFCSPASAKEPTWIQNVSEEYITDLAVSEDGSRVVVGTSMGGLYLYDGNGSLLWSERYKGTMSVGIASDASLIVSGESESSEKDKGTLRVYDRNGTLAWRRHTGWISGFGISEDLGRIAVGNRLGQVVVYDHEGSEEFLEDNLLKRYSPVSALALSADGIYAGYSLLEKTPAIYLINVDTWGIRTISSAFREYGSAVHTIRFTGNGTYLLAASGEGSTDKAYLFTNRGVMRWNESIPHIHDMEISSDGDLCVIGSDDGCIRVYDTAGNLSWTRCMRGAIQTLSITPQGDLLVAGSEEGEIYLMDSEGAFVWMYTPQRFPRATIQAAQISSLGSAVVTVVNRNEILYFTGEPDPPIDVTLPEESDQEASQIPEEALQEPPFPVRFFGGAIPYSDCGSELIRAFQPLQ